MPGRSWEEDDVKRRLWWDESGRLGSAGLYHPAVTIAILTSCSLATTMSGTNSEFPIDLKALKPYVISPLLALWPELMSGIVSP